MPTPPVRVPGKAAPTAKDVKAHRMNEIVQCASDPVYFFDTYCKIQHPMRGLIPFETFPFQQDCIHQFEAHRFNIVVKSRQLGLSTLVAAYAAWLAIFKRDQNILIIATKQSVAYNLMKKIKLIVKELPPWLMITKVASDNKTTFEMENGSTVKAVPTSEDSGRSEALSLLIVDECAIIKGFDELWASIYPTLSTGGRAILFSTPKGVGGTYHDIYSKAVAGLNDFNPITLPWDVHPEHDQKWFDKETKPLSPRQVAQEMLCSFAASGNTFIDVSDIDAAAAGTLPTLDRVGPNRNCWIWRPPEAGRRYVVGADVARGDAKDYSAFHVLDAESGEQVAEFMGQLPPDQFSAYLAEIGRTYSSAVVCVEANNLGQVILMKLKETGYPSLYRRGAAKWTPERGFLSVADKDTPLEDLGMITSSKTRPAMLSGLEEAVRTKRITIRSTRTIDQMKTFVWEGDRAQAIKGKNDDLIMSLAITCWMAGSTGETDPRESALVKSLILGMGVTKQKFQGPGMPPTIEEKMGGKPLLPAAYGTSNTAAARRQVPYWWLLGR